MADVEDRLHAAGLSSRALCEGDVQRIVELLTEYDLEFFGEPMVDAEDVLAEWSSPSFDLDRDSLGLMSGEELVAGGALNFRGQLETSLRRELRNSPVEASMIDYFEAAARARGLPAVHQVVAERDQDRKGFLSGLGYHLDFVGWVLQLRPETEIVTRTLPDGYAVRPFEPADAEDAYTVISEAFAEWQPDQRSYQDWRAAILGRPGADPGHFRVATWCDPADGRGRIVGACTAFDTSEEAWVAQLAVHRDHRTRGLAQRLLAETYAAARQRGVARGGLGTDSRTGALELYRRLGMEVVSTLEHWSKAL